MPSNTTSRKAKVEAAAPGGGGSRRLVVGTVVAVLAVVLVTAVVIFASRGSEAERIAGGSAVPTGSAGMGQGLLVSGSAPAGAPVVDLYVDFQCPNCKKFEEIFGPQLDTLADQGKIRLVVHTLTFLDDNLGNDASNRAANAAACAADQGKFAAYQSAVFAGQPANEGDGYTDAQLKDFAAKAGVTGAAQQTWQKCYDDRAHNQWVESVQTASDKAGIAGTPTIKVAGKDLDLNTISPQVIDAAVRAATK